MQNRLLATTITTRFATSKAWEAPEYARQLQIVIRILSVIQEFRRLYDILMLAISNNSRQDTLNTLIAAVATWHPPLEGMGVLPNVIDALVANVMSIISQLTSVEDRPFVKRNQIHISLLFYDIYILISRSPIRSLHN